MQRNRPVAAAGLQGSVDCVRASRSSLETDRQILMFCSLTSQLATQVAVAADCALDDSRALERVETKSLLANRHQALGCRPPRGIHRHDGSYPAALQAMPGQNLTGLQPLAQIPRAARQKRNQNQSP